MHPLDADATLVDHLIRAVGGGQVLCLGPRADRLVREFRRRAVDAVADTSDALTLVRRARAETAPAHLTRAFDVVVLEHLLDDLDEPGVRGCLLSYALRLTRRALLLRAHGRTRLAWEGEVLAFPCRKHPLHQWVVPYDGLDWEGATITLLIEPLPAGLRVGQELRELAATRDLHMDMLREGGSRADAHVARYMFARQFIRPADRVIDAACGLGYGSAILTDGTLAASVEGLDADAFAIDYASDHYARARPRLSFATADVMALASRPAASVDAIVSFETLEHLADPDAFAAMCRRLLTPGGRLITSVPNEWVNEAGEDPNPYHLHVFNRERLEALYRRYFFVEHVYGQTAGQGMKLPDAGRRLWRSEHGDDAEWWLAVGMTDPVGHAAGPVRHGLTAGPVDDALNTLAFDRDYQHPWLVRAMTTIGLRTESEPLLRQLSARTLDDADPMSADAGAAMCVTAYRHLDRHEPLPPELLDRMRAYAHTPSDVPHVRRWQISLCYVEGLSWLDQGDPDQATTALDAAATADPLTFSPLLATKTVSAAFLLGWVALQQQAVERARRHWTHGVSVAERALHRPWDEFLLDRTSPALFGLREATVIVDLASQCASGLALLEHAADRPGIVAAQLFESLHGRLAASARALDVATRPAPDGPVQDWCGASSAGPSWTLLEHLGLATLTHGAPTQLGAWDVELDDVFTRNVLLHPPATLEAMVPFQDAGRLTAKVAIHPDAWGRDGASACQFSITVDGIAQASVQLDPHTQPAHRHWIDLSLDVPATTDTAHRLRLETRSLQAPYFGWALFRDVRFEPAPASAAKAPAAPAPALSVL